MISADKVEQLIKKYTKNNKHTNWQAVLDCIIKDLPKERWEGMIGDTAEKREVFIDGAKWKTARWFIRLFVQDKICPKCGKELSERFQLHHHNWKGNFDYYALDINRLEAIHFHCHEKEHQIKTKRIFEKVYQTKKKVKNMKNEEFYNAIMTLSCYETTRSEGFSSVLRKNLSRSFAIDVVSVLQNLGFLRRHNKGQHSVTDELLQLARCSKDDIVGLYEAWNQSSRKVPGLALQRKANEVVACERLKHPTMIGYLTKIGISVRKLEHTASPFLKMKLDNLTREREQCEKMEAAPPTSATCVSLEEEMAIVLANNVNMDKVRNRALQIALEKLK